MNENIEIFCCYAREDQSLLHELKKHLMALQRVFPITIWHDQNISPGKEWEHEISMHLNNAHVILILVSPDFIASDYCYSKELQRAMERHERGDARVIPIILRPVYWQKAPFAKLQALPTEGKPVLGPTWHSQDEAFFQVVEGIRGSIDDLRRISLNKAKNYQKQKEGSFPVDSEVFHRPSPTNSSQQGQQVPESAHDLFARSAQRSAQTRGIPEWLQKDHVHPVLDRRNISSKKSLSTSAKVPQTSRSADPQEENIVGSTISTYRGHTRCVRAVAWSPNGTYLASGGEDKTVHVWNAVTGELALTYHGHSKAGTITAVAWAPDGTRIASASNDGTIQIWNVALGQHLYTYQQFPSSKHRSLYSVCAVEWSYDGTHIASAGEALHLWETSTGRCIGRYMPTDPFDLEESRGISVMAWSPNRTRIVLGVGNRGDVEMIDALTGERLFSKPSTGSSPINALVWSPDGTQIAWGQSSNNIAIWKAVTGKHVLICGDNQLERTYDVDIYGLDWSPDNKFIVSGQTASHDIAQAIIWNASTGKCLFRYNGHVDATIIHSVAWSPDGEKIASAGNDMIVQVWHV